MSFGHVATRLDPSHYFFKRRTYTTSALMSASESSFLKPGIFFPRPLLMELNKRSSVTSFCHSALVRSRAWVSLPRMVLPRPSFPWHLAHLASKVVLASPELTTEFAVPA